MSAVVDQFVLTVPSYQNDGGAWTEEDPLQNQVLSVPEMKDRGPCIAGSLGVVKPRPALTTKDRSGTRRSPISSGVAADDNRDRTCWLDYVRFVQL